MIEIGTIRESMGGPRTLSPAFGDHFAGMSTRDTTPNPSLIRHRAP